ncbi:MAG: dihydropteroate synthase [Chthoniobacterales bacterium]
MSSPWLWQIGGQHFDLQKNALLMGILNVTPDSFSDGGEFFSKESAVEQGLRLLEQGADILDIGGESTRPGASSVSAEEEMSRTLPVIQELRSRTSAPLSIDTSKPEVARAAVKAGVSIINDVTGFTKPSMRAVAAESSCGLVVMHAQGSPATMQQQPFYTDVVAEVSDFLRTSLRNLEAVGIAADRIILDPGIGFGKTAEHNAKLLANIPDLGRIGRPLLIGVSRKSFLGRIANSDAMEDRYWPGIALTVLGRETGARIFRVHEPVPHRQALKITESIINLNLQT